MSRRLDSSRILRGLVGAREVYANAGSAEYPRGPRDYSLKQCTFWREAMQVSQERVITLFQCQYGQLKCLTLCKPHDVCTAEASNAIKKGLQIVPFNALVMACRLGQEPPKHTYLKFTTRNMPIGIHWKENEDRFIPGQSQHNLKWSFAYFSCNGTPCSCQGRTPRSSNCFRCF